MEARLILASRVEALRQDLALATGALRSDAIRVDFRDSVKVLFGGFFERKTRDLETLSKALKDEKAGLERGSLSDHWKRLEEHAEDCDTILKEYLAFLEGALVRTAKLDAGICDVADAFLRQLAHDSAIDWTRFTIVAEAEFLARLTDIIRVRYPHFSIWNLPVLAHEFGHFVTPQLKDRVRGTLPLNELKRDVEQEFLRSLPPAARGGAAGSVVQLEEYIADAFAAHTIGPAFACACIHLRFEPAHAHEEHDGYPSEARRAQLIFRMLDTLNNDYAKVTGRLREHWRDSLTAAGVAGPAADPWLDGLADRLKGTFEDVAPKAKFSVDQWRRATAFGLRLSTPDWNQGAKDLTLGEVLNGAWLCRLTEGANVVPTIGGRALDLCRQLAEKADN